MMILPFVNITVFVLAIKSLTKEADQNEEKFSMTFKLFMNS